MNVATGIVAPQFLSWEYLFRIFGIVYLQFWSDFTKLFPDASFLKNNIFGFDSVLTAAKWSEIEEAEESTWKAVLQSVKVFFRWHEEGFADAQTSEPVRA